MWHRADASRSPAGSTITRSIGSLMWIPVELRPGEVVNSSRPILRCAFCIGILLGKHCGSAVCEDEGQALGEPFAFPDRGHLLVIGLLEVVHDFAGFPTRDVARLARSKYAIEQTRATQNSVSAFSMGHALALKTQVDPLWRGRIG